jgi:hypothetical protein
MQRTSIIDPGIDENERNTSLMFWKLNGWAPGRNFLVPEWAGVKDFLAVYQYH